MANVNERKEPGFGMLNHIYKKDKNKLLKSGV